MSNLLGFTLRPQVENLRYSRFGNLRYRGLRHLEIAPQLHEVDPW